jgi:uncharacterized membrane protein YbaN (DUF454 family)
LDQILAMVGHGRKRRIIRDSDSAMMYIVEAADSDRRSFFRLAMLALGWLSVTLGIIGIVVPGAPGTVFLLVAVWAFSRSSPRLHRWLFEHPRWGTTIRAWHIHRAIPPPAKILAVGGMVAGLAVGALWLDDGWGVPVAMAVAVVPVAVFILTRPGGPRSPDPKPG